MWIVGRLMSRDCSVIRTSEDATANNNGHISTHAAVRQVKQEAWKELLMITIVNKLQHVTACSTIYQPHSSNKERPLPLTLSKCVQMCLYTL